MPSTSGAIGQRLLGGIKSHARTAIISGVVLAIAGVAAIAAPLVAGASLMMVIGAVLVVSGISLMMFAFRLGALGLGLPLRLLSVLMCVAGAYLFSRPLEALGATTLVLAAYMVVSGIVELVAAFGARPERGWGWMALSAVIGLVLGVMLWQQFPLSGVWAVGTLFGIRLLTSGISLIAMGSAVKQTAEAALGR